MRKIGSVFEFRKERREDLLRAYREQLDKSERIFLPELLIRVVSSPAKRFWVSEERAIDTIGKMLRGKDPHIKRETTKRMFLEILRRVKDMKRLHPDMETARIIGKVILQPAPEFYITPESAEVIIHHFKHEIQKER